MSTDDDGEVGIPGLDLGALLEQAQQMQQSLMEAQNEAAEQQVTGVSGGGAVRITATGSGEFVSVDIEPSAVDPDDVEMLQDLVLAALHDTSARVAEINQRALGGLGELGGLGGLLGG